MPGRSQDGESGTTTFGVREVARAGPRTRIVRLALDGHTFPFEAGQAIMVGLAGSALKKPYSIASSPGEARRTGAIELLAQIDDPHLERVQAGARLEIEGPFGTFGLPAAAEPTLLVAGGTGIAPIRSIVVEWLDAGAGGLSLVHSARSAAELAYRADLEARGCDQRLMTFFTVTREDEAWGGRRGRVDEALLRKAMRSAAGARCVACGPPALLDEVRRILPRIGISAGRFFTQQA